MPFQLEGPVIGLLVALSFVLALVWVVLRYRHNARRQLHETILYMVEKGVEVPPALISTLIAAPHRLYWAFTAIGAGIGLIAWLVNEGSNEWAIGLIPLTVGFAQLLAIKIESNLETNFETHFETKPPAVDGDGSKS